VGQVVLAHRPPLARLAHALDDLLPAERLGRARPLHHGQLDDLLGGEPLLARRAHPPTPDRRAVVADAAVQHPGVGVAAVWAVHVPLLSRRDAVVAPIVAMPGPVVGVRACHEELPSAVTTGEQAVDDLGTSDGNLWVTNHYLWIITSV
jgi:hypothetical protein